MDLDINGAAMDQVFVFDNNRPNQGWGPGWLKYTTELDEVKNPATNRRWFVRDHPGGHGVWIIPGPNDGTSDAFSNRDISARLYRGSEDQAWPFGAWGDLGYLNGENIEEKDVVFWYVAHLHHEEEGGADQWHSVGPWLFVAR